MTQRETTTTQVNRTPAARAGQGHATPAAAAGPTLMASPSAIAHADRSGSDHLALSAPGPLADQPSWARLIRHARCADAGLDPDEWFPVSTKARQARREAAEAIAICNSCPVRTRCLALSLQHWDIGKHGVWGGLVAPERAQLRRRIADRSGYGRALTHVMAAISAK
ncbi:MAG TPA: WhiB family transcriptional regulator [Streptosporangiaceae bacterium]|jgi:hypothetical protein